MIKTSELRIGNEIQVFGDIVEVTDIDIDTIGTTAYFDGHKGCCGCTEMMAEGIPLTDDALEKMGFSYKDGADAYGEYRKNGCNIYKHDDEPGFFHFSLGLFNGKQIEIKYVHQLQNLYFALIGEELQIEA